jgi:uncharacterized protein
MSSSLAIMVKTPALSPVKSRLWPGIGRSEAEALYLISAQAVAEVAQQAGRSFNMRPYWAVAEAAALQTDAWPDLPNLPQGAGGLGERMAHVYRQLRMKHSVAMLVGADAPQLTASALGKAAGWLSGGEARLVIGRAPDGGFWLFGGNTALSDHAWTKLQYGAPDTAEHFIQAMEGAGRWMELEPLRDIDTVADLPHVMTSLATLAAPTPGQLRLMDHLTALLQKPLPGARPHSFVQE